MKKLFLLTCLFLSSFLGAQSVSLVGNETWGQNCSSSQQPVEAIVYGDLNLNNFRLRLKNVQLTVTGNLNGGGEIVSCGSSTICVQGSVQNNPTLDEDLQFSCSTLSVDTFEKEPPVHLKNGVLSTENHTIDKIYSMEGRLLLEPRKNNVYIGEFRQGVYIIVFSNTYGVQTSKKIRL